MCLGGNALTKELSQEVLGYPVKGLRALLTSMIKGDGGASKSGTRYYSSRSQNLVYGVADVGLKLGYSPRIKSRYRTGGFKPGTQYLVSLRTKPARHGASIKRGKLTTRQYSGVVWCPTVENGNFLAFYDGNYFFTGNCPYPNLASPQVNKRLHGYSDGSLWYARKTARSLVQMTGRATRSMDDYSTSYILDKQFIKLVSRNKSIFPQWWASSVREGNLS